jgi:A/G-specific adenine glycosylase
VDRTRRNAKSGISSTLLSWFDKNGRTFPWRETFEAPDPYIILFTEIMLQRTRAEQVIPIYLEFVRKYPTFEDLSRASEDEIISLFGRLGLRWRAKNVVTLIRQIRDEFHGSIPREIEDLRSLSSVGEYVAAAVACYAFGHKTVAVDSNVVRVISRLLDLDVTLDSGRRSATFLRRVADLMPENRVQDFNLALLDVSAMICKPKPLCDICPLASYCAFYSKSNRELPQRRKRTTTSTLIRKC